MVKFNSSTASLLLLVSCATSAGAFTTTPHVGQAAAIRSVGTPTTTPRSLSSGSSGNKNEKIDELLEKVNFSKGMDAFQDMGSQFKDMGSQFKNIDLDTTTFDITAVSKNLMDGEMGTRGEEYAIVQAVLIGFILIGGIPFVGDALFLVLGPVLAVTGIAVAVLGLKDLGSSLSPWPVPPTSGALVTNGIYEKIRHPLYTGLICTMAGISLVSGSAIRLFFTGILIYSLDVKSNYEESKLIDKYGEEYLLYKDQVKGKFIPEDITNSLPWL